MQILNLFRRLVPRALLVFAMIAFGMAKAPGAANNSAAEIRAVMAAQVAAWNRGDIDGFMAGYARSAKTEFVSGEKVTRGWQTVRDRYRKKYDSRERMGRLRFSQIEITPLSADAAVVVGRWRLLLRNQKPHGLFTLIFRSTPAGWRIIHDHTSTAPAL